MYIKFHKNFIIFIRVIYKKKKKKMLTDTLMTIVNKLY